MIESLQQYWYMWIVLLALIAVAVFAGIKASKAVKKRGEIMKKQLAEMERAEFLIKKYSALTHDLAVESDAEELAAGVTEVLQSELGKSPNPDEEYMNAAKWRREVYALFYFDEDIKDSLSFFFRNNEKPLPFEALNGLESIDEPKLRSMAAAMWSMYDDSNESVSLDNGRVEELNRKFKEEYNKAEFFEKIKKYIIDNI